MKRELLTTKEAARLLKVSTRTLIRWRKYGLGPRCFDLLGGKARRPRYRYPLQDIDRYMQGETNTHGGK